MEESRLKVIEICISAGGLSLALLVGIVAYMDYRDRAQLQSMRALHSAQLDLCIEASTLSSALISSSDIEELDANIDRLSLIKHGKGLILLEQNVMDALVALYNAAIFFTLRDEIDDSFQLDLTCEVGEKALEVVHQCRHMLAKAFERESNFTLDLVDERYTAGWSCNEGETDSRRKSAL